MKQDLKIYELLDGREIVTSDEEIMKILLALREKMVKFGDIPKLLTEHSYLFRNCDPIWKREFEWNRTTSTSTLTPITLSLNNKDI